MRVIFVAVLSNPCMFVQASQWVYVFVGLNMSCFSWFMFRGQIISFVLIQNLACYSGDPKHVYYNENMNYFHYPYWGAIKELQGFARTATICDLSHKERYFLSICGKYERESIRLSKSDSKLSKFNCVLWKYVSILHYDRVLTLTPPNTTAYPAK